LSGCRPRIWPLAQLAAVLYQRENPGLDHCKLWQEEAFLLYILKVHKHEIIYNFFLPKSNPYMPSVNFQKNFAFFLRFSPEF
jgi:hypothetical protein